MLYCFSTYDKCNSGFRLRFANKKSFPYYREALLVGLVLKMV